MNDHQREFFTKLLSTPGPSGEEHTVAALWRAEAKTFADSVTADVRGNSVAMLRGGNPRALLYGHIDEIGLMISHIDEQGFLYVLSVGGWDPQVLVGQRVRIIGKAGDVVGVIGKKPIHLMKGDERDRASKLENLWIDIGAITRDEALERVQVGNVAVIELPLIDLPNNRVASRALDNRVGAFAVLETIRLLTEQQRPQATVAAVASTQEEIGSPGAKTATFLFDPHIALVVDATFATDHPDSNKREWGDVKLGGGPVLSYGGVNTTMVVRRLIQVAEQEQIPLQWQMSPGRSGTDADVVYNSRGGVATAVISIPLRYMHSPNEMVALEDLDMTARLMAAFVRSLRSEQEFVPEA